MAAAIVIWLISFVACGFVGLPLLFHEGLSLARLRQIAQREEPQLET